MKSDLCTETREVSMYLLQRFYCFSAHQNCSVNCVILTNTSTSNFPSNYYCPVLDVLIKYMSSFVAWILEIPTDQLRKCKETNPKCPGRISKKSKEARNGNQNKIFKCLCPKFFQQNFPFNFLTKTHCCHFGSLQLLQIEKHFRP